MKECKTQIAIVGGGASGLAAAAAASEAGAEVMVLEANAAVGGNGLFPRGIFGVDSRIQRRKLIFADPDEVFAKCMEYSHWKIDARVTRALIDISGATIGWLEGMGVQFTDVVHHLPNQTPEVFHITGAEENTGKAVVRALKACCQQRGAAIRTGIRGKKLAQDESGAVTGVFCEDRDGVQELIRADKVIICTGGFAGNKELILKFFPNYDPGIVKAGGGMRHDGEGVQMAMDAGADIEGNFAFEIAAPKIKGFEPLNLLIGKPYNVWLNKLGRRFADEGIVYNFTQSANACMRQPDGFIWVVFDQGCFDKALKDGRDMIELIHIPPNAEDELQQTVDGARADGILKVSETLPGLADLLGCAADTLEKSIGEYNAFCEHNHDAIFAKKRAYLKKLATPPFYAVKAGADMIITHGGIRVSERFEALNRGFEPVPNLYVAGADFGGTDADIYNVIMSGHSFGFAVNSGRIAGMCAAGASRGVYI